MAAKAGQAKPKIQLIILIANPQIQVKQRINLQPFRGSR